MSMTFEQQKDILDHTYNLLTKFNNGVPPRGSVAPWWETSKEGTMLLLEKGIEYGTPLSSLPLQMNPVTDRCHTDHSNMAHEYVSRKIVIGRQVLTSRFTSSQAFYLRDQDLWTKIDYKAKAETWMQPLVRGNETGLVEIPANWYLDDLPPMM